MDKTTTPRLRHLKVLGTRQLRSAMRERTIPAGDVQISQLETAATSDDASRRRRPGLTLAVIVACQLMVILDLTIVNIALPQIQTSLHFSATSLSWVLNAYTLTFGGLLLLGGRAGDILGRRRVLVAGVLLFSLASLLGGFAPSAGWLLLARAAQGVGGAIASPTALALIATNFGEGPARNRALGIYAAVSSGGASLGLMAGGMLTSWLSWRWVLFVNVPIGIAIALLAPLFIEESPRREGRFDLAGALTSTAGMASLVYGFIRASSSGWSDGVTRLAFAAAVALLALFLTIELRSRQPITPLHLFANRDRSSAHAIRLLLVAGMFGTFFFLTQLVQGVLGFSPLKAGFAFLPMTVALFASARAASRLLPRFGAKRLTVTGTAITAAGMLWLSQVSAGSSYFPGVLGPMLLFGLGVGLPFVGLTLLALSGVEPPDTGAASSLVNVTQQVGGSLGLALLVTVFGTASRSAGTATQLREALAHGISSAFTASTILVACALLLATAAISARAGRPARAPAARR
jgi:EmrB/QacA subfamily drug resistance transporter